MMSGRRRLGIAVGPGCASMVGCDQVFYYPNARKYGSPRQYRLNHESIHFPSRDGTMLHGWFFPAEKSATGTVLHLHGNAGNITGHFQHVTWLPPAGWNVFCFDYRGYGESQGKVTRAGTIADAHGALDYLLSRSDADAHRIVALGQSLGGAVGVVLTAERPEVRGLATDGAFDHYRRIVSWHIRRNPLLLLTGWWVPRLLVPNGYDPIDYVAKIAPRPILIMQGTADRVVNPAMAERLYETAGKPKELWMIQGADHYEAMEEMGDQTHPRLLEFFERCVET